MRHLKAGRKFGRNPDNRQAMLRNMLASFFEHERIRTTDVRAKTLRPMAEKLITMSKRGDLHTRRLLLRTIHDPNIVDKLIGEIALRYKDRPGGYTRIIKVGIRPGDNTPMSIIELFPTDQAKTDAPTKDDSKTDTSET